MATSYSTPSMRDFQSPSKQWLAPVARAGYLARAVIYMTIGGLAGLSLYFSASGEMTDSKGSIKALLDNSYGFYLIVVLAIGLVCYSIWRFFQSTFDADNHGADTKGLAVRAGLMVSCITHLSLAFYCYNLLSGSSTSGGGKQGLVAQIMDLPFGPWLVGLVGLVVLGFGVSQLVKAATEKYRDHIQFPGNQKVLDGISKAGLVSRAVVFLVAGGSIGYAAWTYDPNQTIATNEMWSFLSSMAFGQVLVTVMAVGLFLFGIYSAIEARYRKI